MPQRWLQLVIFAVLLACLLGPVAELFDQWDHTIATGGDTEFNTVVVALIVGVVFALISLMDALLLARNILVGFFAFLLAARAPARAGHFAHFTSTSVLRV